MRCGKNKRNEVIYSMYADYDTKEIASIVGLSCSRIRHIANEKGIFKSIHFISSNMKSLHKRERTNQERESISQKLKRRHRLIEMMIDEGEYSSIYGHLAMNRKAYMCARRLVMEYGYKWFKDNMYNLYYREGQPRSNMENTISKRHGIVFLQFK